MFRISLSLLCCLILAPALRAQAVYTASRRADIQVGIQGSAFTLDNGSGHEEGLGVYGDIDVSKHLGLEALYRDASIQTPHDIGENHLLAGPRFHLQRGRLSPYAKVLFGEGTINFQYGYQGQPFNTAEHYFIYVFGGGLDFHATRHINVRLIDFEYQEWPGFAPHGLTPYGYSAGVAYHF